MALLHNIKAAPLSGGRVDASQRLAQDDQAGAGDTE